MGAIQMIKQLSIVGLRGFGKEQLINFAVPNNNAGSGITFLVGANNSGKTTIIEALRSFNCDPNSPPNFSERKRNKKCEGGKVHLKVMLDNNDVITIDSTNHGGSPTTLSQNGVVAKGHKSLLSIYTLQSRRYVEYEFHKNSTNREQYLQNQHRNIHNRSASLYDFGSRLFAMYEKKQDFDKLLQNVLGYDLTWTIEQSENGQYFIKFTVGGQDHSSEGLGDGIWSIFTICDALYDSKPGDMIVIDEPELSLHPAYQKKTLKLIKEFSKDRQIVISTHSPYFIDIQSLIAGANLHRTFKNNQGDIEVHQLSDEAKSSLSGFLNDLNQPHTFGTEAKELFFMEDNIILVEGQEDVIMYSRAAEMVSIELQGNFFGWGAGGAPKIPKVLKILDDLGYRKVVVIFDGDKSADKEQIEKQYSQYQYLIISTADVRDKRAIEHRPAKVGLMRENGTLKEEYKQEIADLLNKINAYWQL